MSASCDILNAERSDIFVYDTDYEVRVEGKRRYIYIYHIYIS